MSATITCRPFGENDWPRVRRFYETVYGPTHVLTRRPFFDWCFFSPLRRGEGSTLTLALSGDDVVGACGFLPWLVEVGGKAEPAVYNVNLFLDPSLRGLGVGQELLASGSREVAYSITIAAAERSVSLYDRLGATYERNVGRFVRVLDRDGVERLVAAGSGAAPGEVADLLEAGPGPAPEPSRGGDGSTVAPVARFDDAWSEAWERIRPRYGFTTRRHADFLNWRYADYPYPLYERFASARDGRPTGLVVTRAEPTPLGGVLRVVDLVSEDDDADETLLAHACSVARARACVLVDLALVGRPPAALSRLGFVELPPGSPGFRALPFDFNPIRCRERIVFVAARVGSTELPRSLARDELYVVKGDGDLDRAN